MTRMRIDITRGEPNGFAVECIQQSATTASQKKEIIFQKDVLNEFAKEKNLFLFYFNLRR